MPRHDPNPMGMVSLCWEGTNPPTGIPCSLGKAEIFLILLSQGVLKSPSSICSSPHISSLPRWAGISSGLKFSGLRMHQQQHQSLAAQLGQGCT